MRIKTEEKDYILSNESIDEISEYVENFCAQFKIERKEIFRYKISIEEALLVWKDSLSSEGKEVSVKVVSGKRLGSPYILLECEGQRIDPFFTDTEDYGQLSTEYLSNIGLTPAYGYLKGVNTVNYKIKKPEMNQLLVLLIAIVASVAVGLGADLVLPHYVVNDALTMFVDPIYNTFFKLLSCIAGPMVFLSVAWGVYGIGDRMTFGRVGKKLMTNFVGKVFLISALSMLMLPFFKLSLSSGDIGGSQFAEILKMILGVVPDNIFQPFTAGNTLQIITLGFIMGLALLFLGKKTDAVARLVEQLDNLIQFLMEIVSKLIPFLIFIIIVDMLWTNTFNVMLSAWKAVLFVAIGAVLVCVGMALFTSLRQKVSFFTMLTKNIPSFLIAFSTASSAAAFSTSTEICEKKYGVASSLSKFGIPLGMVMQKPASALGFMVFALYFSEIYDVNCSIAWIVTAIIIVSILAISIPPIPGGAAAAYTILFTQLGIPIEGLAVALALDVVIDFIVTAADTYVIPFSVINTASKLGLLDQEVLKKK